MRLRSLHISVTGSFVCDALMYVANAPQFSDRVIGNRWNGKNGALKTLFLMRSDANSNTSIKWKLVYTKNVCWVRCPLTMRISALLPTLNIQYRHRWIPRYLWLCILLEVGTRVHEVETEASWFANNPNYRRCTVLRLDLSTIHVHHTLLLKLTPSAKLNSQKFCWALFLGHKQQALPQ
jgi:hypothetical protein